MAFCPKCGKAYEGNPSFCPNCGSALTMAPAMSQGSRAPAATQPTKPSNTTRNVILAIAVILIIVLIVGFIYYSGYSNQLSYPQVNVSGTINTVGAGTTPIRVDFTSSSGSTYSAQVTNNGYSITLPNHDTYSVSVDYETIISSTGTCSAGSLGLNVAANYYTFNTSC